MNQSMYAFVIYSVLKELILVGRVEWYFISDELVSMNNILYNKL